MIKETKLTHPPTCTLASWSSAPMTSASITLGSQHSNGKWFDSLTYENEHSIHETQFQRQLGANHVGWMNGLVRWAPNPGDPHGPTICALKQRSKPSVTPLSGRDSHVEFNYSHLHQLAYVGTVVNPIPNLQFGNYVHICSPPILR